MRVRVPPPVPPCRDLRTMTATDTPLHISIAAAVLSRADGRVLVVRKRGSGIFMQPGGKIEPGEKPADALVRELAEELRIAVDAEAASFLGEFAAPAANEAGAVVTAQIFAMPFDGAVSPAAEIEEARWIDPAAPGDIVLAELSRNHVLPAWLARRGGD